MGTSAEDALRATLAQNAGLVKATLLDHDNTRRLAARTFAFDPQQPHRTVSRAPGTSSVGLEEARRYAAGDLRTVQGITSGEGADQEQRKEQSNKESSCLITTSSSLTSGPIAGALEEYAPPALLVRRDFPVDPLVFLPRRKRAYGRSLQPAPRKIVRRIARLIEDLAPVRVDLEVEGIKVRDTFTWNAREYRHVPNAAAMVARTICEDLNLPLDLFLKPLVETITEQTDDFLASRPSQIEPVNSAGRGTVNVDMHSKSPCGDKEEAPGPEVTNESLDLDGDDHRIVIVLDITIGNRKLTDKFEWDLTCRRNVPERFAEHMCTELRLEPEFKVAIAHSIREQIQYAAKSLLLSGHDFVREKSLEEEVGVVDVGDGPGVPKEQATGHHHHQHHHHHHNHNRASNSTSILLPSISVTRRNNHDSRTFGPYLDIISHQETEKMEREFDRDSRRKKRQTNRSRKAQKSSIITPQDKEVSFKTKNTYAFNYETLMAAATNTTAANSGGY